jgi:hypothetical protein
MAIISITVNITMSIRIPAQKGGKSFPYGGIAEIASRLRFEECSIVIDRKRPEEVTDIGYRAGYHG